MLYDEEHYFAERGVPPVYARWDLDKLVENADVKLTTHKDDATVAALGADRPLGLDLVGTVAERGRRRLTLTLCSAACRNRQRSEALQFVHDLDRHEYRVSPPTSWRDLGNLLWPSQPAML